MMNMLLAFFLAALSEGIVALRVIHTAERRPILAGIFAAGCRSTSLLVVLTAIDSKWSICAAAVGYFVGPVITITLTNWWRKNGTRPGGTGDRDQDEITDERK